MSHDELLKAIQSRAARMAVGASAVRGRGNAGTAAAARKYFVELDLWAFSVEPEEFRRVLDKHTERLLKKLPEKARHWGIARKILNIFLRDCLYTGELERAFKLATAKEAFELPLDSITVKALKRDHKRGELPRWKGVKNLTKPESHRYQEAALATALRKGVRRVDLDAFWWAQGRDG